MNELALFAGAGGGILGGLLCGFRTVCAVEIDEYRRRVLMQRQDDGLLEPCPIWPDIRDFDGRPWAGCVDIVTAGVPCQPWSVAGKRDGEADERNLWPEVWRIVREVGPLYVFMENVPGLLSWNGGAYFGVILSELAEMGYDCRWGVLGASDVGAPHIRKRIWILADADSAELRHEPGRGSGADRPYQTEPGDHGAQGDVADAAVLGPQAWQPWPEKGRARGRGMPAGCGWWTVEPNVDRVAYGISNRVDRIKALGDSQVPAVAALAWRVLTNVA